MGIQTHSIFTSTNNNDDTHKGDMDVENMQRERRRKGEKNWRYWLMFNGGIQIILPNLHTKQYPTTTLGIITIRNVYRNLGNSSIKGLNYKSDRRALKTWTQSGPTWAKFSKWTYSVSVHFVSRSTATSHHRLQYGHPALLVRKAWGHEVEGLAWPAGGVGMWF